MSKKSFTQRLSERGYPEGKSGSKRFYRGLAFTDPGALAQHRGDGVDRISGNSRNLPF